MATITSLSQLDTNGIYSYADYLSWKFDQTLEVIKGKIFPMSTPSRTHQKISWNSTLVLREFMKGHQCDAYAAPFDVRLYNRAKSIRADEDIYTVVQPDLCIVCDLEKLDERGCLGAPDLIVEILSPGNAKREMKIKRELYAESGVEEYWVVDPARETLTRYNLDAESGYDRPLIFVSDEMVSSAVFPDLVLDLEELFAGIKD